MIIIYRTEGSLAFHAILNTKK